MNPYGHEARHHNGTVPVSQELAETIATHLFAAKCFMLASFIVLVWEHCITFSDEIEKIWKPKLSGASVLFLLNRYITLVQFTVILIAFQDNWSDRVCQRFFKTPGALALISVTIAVSIMILRTYALYQGNIHVLTGLGLCLLIQVGLMSSAMTNVTAVPLPKGLVGCILAGNNGFSVTFWLAPLFTDTVVFALTVAKSIQFLRNDVSTSLVAVLLRDGIMYFVVILVVNVSNVLMFFLGPPTLKVFGASFSHVITTVMVARLQLNLKSKRIRDSHFDSSGSNRYLPNSRLSWSSELNAPALNSELTGRFRNSTTSHDPPSPGDTLVGDVDESHGNFCSWLRFSFKNNAFPLTTDSIYDHTVGNLGEPLDAWWDDSDDEEKYDLYVEATPRRRRRVWSLDGAGRSRTNRAHVDQEDVELVDHGNGVSIRMDDLSPAAHDSRFSFPVDHPPLSLAGSKEAINLISLPYTQR